jgi:hypothetical protein
MLIAALSAMHRSQVDHHGLRTLTSGGGGEGAQAPNEVVDSSFAPCSRQLLDVAIGSGAVPKRVRSVHDADADDDDDDALCLVATGPSYHAKRREGRLSSDADSVYRSSNHLPSLAHRPRAH